LHPQFPSEDSRVAPQAFDGRAAVIGIKQTIRLGLACLRQFGHALFGDFLFFISLASWRAMTALIVAAVISSRMPPFIEPAIESGAYVWVLPCHDFTPDLR
jgi:hypothetical protein